MVELPVLCVLTKASGGSDTLATSQRRKPEAMIGLCDASTMQMVARRGGRARVKRLDQRGGHAEPNHGHPPTIHTKSHQGVTTLVVTDCVTC